MSRKAPIRVLIVTVSIATLLVLTVSMAGICHHHQRSTETNCPICHLNHQPIERPLSSTRIPVLAPIAPSVEPQVSDFAPSPVSPRVPGRAPPLA